MATASARTAAPPELKLPDPNLRGQLQKLLTQRRSRRNFKRSQLTPAQLALLLWSAQGRVSGSHRVVPSAGATYPLNLLAALNHPGVPGFVPGLYRYLPERNALWMEHQGNLLHHISEACYGQSFIAVAQVVLILTAEPARITPRYGDRAYRYIYMEAGHSGQNVHLAAESLDLGTVMVGAFDDEELAKVLRLPEGHEPVYLFPIGSPV